MIVTQEEIINRLLNNKFLREIKTDIGLSVLSNFEKGGEGRVRPGWYLIAYIYLDHEEELAVLLCNIRLRDGEYDLVNNLLQRTCNDLTCSFIDLSALAREKKGGLQQTLH